MASTLEARSLRRHPLHTAGRLAHLARIGFKHPRSRLHVLEFDRGHDSDGLVASLQAAHGMPLLLSDQVSVLGGSVSPTLGMMRPTVVGGRLLQPRRTDDGGVRIDSQPWVDPDIAFDVRIAEKVLHHVGFLSPSELFLANAILRQSVDDVAVDVDGNAGVRALAGAGMLDSRAEQNVTLSQTGEPCYYIPASATGWTPVTAAALADLSAHLLFGEQCILRHLTQRTVVPTADGIVLTCLDSVRRVPESAVDAGRALVEAGRGSAAALRELVAHLRATSAGAESAAAYGEAAQRVVARAGERLDATARNPRQITDTGLPELAEPFATCLVIGQIVYLARLLEFVEIGSTGP